MGPGVENDSTNLGPSLFVQYVVRHNGADAFTIDRPAWDGPSGMEPMVQVLARSLLVLAQQGLPPVFTWKSRLSPA